MSGSPCIVVTLGIQFMDLYGLPVAIAVEVPSLELDPDAVFVASNRIGELKTDLCDLPHRWQRQLRALIDQRNAPSMSVEDTIDLYSATHVHLGTWVCERNSWSHRPAHVETSPGAWPS